MVSATLQIIKTGGLEDRLPMLWTHGVRTGKLTMNEFVAVTSTNIAKILNCYLKRLPFQ